MPLYALICRDNPDSLPTRLATREAHLAYVRDTGLVAMAGPLIEDGEMRGSLIILDAPDIDAARRWAEADPYAAAGLFARTEITEWKKVIG